MSGEKVYAADFLRLGVLLAMLRRTSGKADAVLAKGVCPQCGSPLLRQRGPGESGVTVSCTNCMYEVSYPADTDD